MTSFLDWSEEAHDAFKLDRYGRWYGHLINRCRLCLGSRQGPRVPQSMPSKPEVARALECVPLRILPK